MQMVRLVSTGERYFLCLLVWLRDDRAPIKSIDLRKKRSILRRLITFGFWGLGVRCTKVPSFHQMVLPHRC